MGEDYSRTGLIVMSFFMIVFSVASTAMRFWSRTINLRGQYGLDDWLCLVALFPTTGLLIIGLYLCYNGLGTPFDELSHSRQVDILRNFFIGALMFISGIGFTKLSALAFYKRIFGSTKKYNTWTWTVSFYVVAFITVGWFVSSIFYTIFRCSPVDKSWFYDRPGQCVDSASEYLFILSLSNLVSDVAIVLLPIPQIFGLKMKTRRKLLVAALLVLAYSIPLISIGRVIIAFHLRHRINADFSREIIPLAFFLLAEPPVSLFAVSLPGAYQLVQRVQRHGIGALFNARDYYLRPGQGRYFIHQRSTDARLGRLRDPALELGYTGQMASYVHAGLEHSSKKTSLPDVEPAEDDYHDIIQPLEMIHVTREIRISYNS